MTAARRGVLDTSAVILLGDVDPAMLPEESVVTTITLAELSAGPLLASDDSERAARLAHLQQAEADFDVVPFDRAAARAFGRVAADLRRAGREPAARAHDALIAAVAVSHGVPVYTANPRDFAGITALDVHEVVAR